MRAAAARCLSSIFSPVVRRRNATGLYCLPFFHIIGVSKCGTTDMFRRLSLHPHVAPSHNKGPHFWDVRRAREPPACMHFLHRR